MSMVLGYIADDGAPAFAGSSGGDAMTREEALALLNAFQMVARSSWPHLAAAEDRLSSWSNLDAVALERELAGRIRASDIAETEVRVFWKMGREFIFAGCNTAFARDAGIASSDDVVGHTDFESCMAWQAQAAKYRKDDREVFETGRAKLDILERQQSATGVLWLRTGKAPIEVAHTVRGILGMYEVIDEAQAVRLNLTKLRTP